MTQCPSCGSQVPGKFCPNCGAQVAQDAAATAMPVPPQPQPQVPPPVPQPGFQPRQPGFQPQQPGYPGFPAQQQKKSGWLKWVLISVGVLAVLLVALSFIGGGATGINGSPTITTAVDQDTKQPTKPVSTVPSNAEKIYASVQVTAKKGTAISAKWYVETTHLDKADFNYTFDADYEGWVSPSITLNGQPWPAGAYKVEFYLDDQKATEKSFSVVK